MANEAVFGGTPKFGAAFTTDSAVVTFGTGGAEDGGLGALVQSVQWQYGRPIQRFYELGAEQRTFFVIGRAEGRLNISRLAAPGPITNAFLKQFSDPCQLENNTLTVGSTSEEACNNTEFGDSSYEFKWVLVDGVGGQINVQSIILLESVSAQFIGYEVGGGNA